MKQWIIYKHTSMQSGKSYVGLTSASIERRWVLFKNKGKNLREGLRAIPRLFKHDDGTEYLGYSAELCKLYNLSTGTMSSVIKGTRNHHKGWRYIKDIQND